MKELKVKDVMTENVISVTAPGKKADAIKLLCKYNISGLPVVKKDTGKVVGIVTRRNIFDHPHEEQIAMLMTKSPVTVKPEMLLRDAIALQLEKGLRRLPVVSNDRLVGFLTSMDSLRVVEKEFSDRTIETLIRGPCVPVYENTPLPVVATIFEVSGAYALPVLDARAKIVGIITDHDLFSVSKPYTKRVASSMGLGDDEDSWNSDGLKNLMRLYYENSEMKLPSVPVRQVMVKKPSTVTIKTSASEAAREMRMHNFRQLPVIDNHENLQSMLYDLDLIKVLQK